MNDEINIRLFADIAASNGAKDADIRRPVPLGQCDNLIAALQDVVLRQHGVILRADDADTLFGANRGTCVARGTSVYLENLELWKYTMESDADEI